MNVNCLEYKSITTQVHCSSRNFYIQFLCLWTRFEYLCQNQQCLQYFVFIVHFSYFSPNSSGIYQYLLISIISAVLYNILRRVKGDIEVQKLTLHMHFLCYKQQQIETGTCFIQNSNIIEGSFIVQYIQIHPVRDEQPLW